MENIGDSVCTVIKVVPQTQGASFKNIVNIFTRSDDHFEDQAIWLKQLYYKFRARRMVVDGNGLGIGLIDYLIKSQTDPDTGEVLPDFGIYNDDDGYYKQYQTPYTVENAVYIIKANAGINTEAHSLIQTQMSSSKIKFLISEQEAKQRLLSTKVGQKMTQNQRADYLKPFTLTSILREELLNLREDNEGINIILKQANKSIKKDKVSSLEYGVYYVKQVEEAKKKRKFNAKDWLLLN